MLTLTRKVGDIVVAIAPDDTEVRIVIKEIRRNQVRIGFAGTDYVVLREEIYEDLEAASALGDYCRVYRDKAAARFLAWVDKTGFGPNNQYAESLRRAFGESE